YLSAEPWVESCHALPSPQAKGLRKFFYFPGFTSATGGLLREPGLLDSRDAWRADPDQRVKLLRSWGLVDSALSRLTQDFLQIALFSYKNAPVQGLMRALTSVRKPVLLLVPCGVCPDLQRG